MVDPETGSRRVDDATGVDPVAAKRTSWRSGLRQGGRGWTRALFAAAVLLGCVAAVAVLSIVLSPLFAWQTAGLALVVDDYVPDLISAVPFADDDLAGLEQSLAGRLAPALGRGLVTLGDFATAAALRDRLHGWCIDLPLRPRDTLICYVRGQCFVPPPLLDADGMPRQDRLAGRACLIAPDATLLGDGVRELVTIRDIVESVGAAASRTTLVAVDLGDLRWDPRLGVLCGMSSRQLERDLVPPPEKANGQNWVLVSNDVLEYSGAAASDRRSFFSAALEAGLAGAADAAPWGDADRVVELHELAPFVAAWTAEWARRVSGGRSVQRPFVIKMGEGRVPFDRIPRGVKLVRVTASASLAVPAAVAVPKTGPEPARPAADASGSVADAPGQAAAPAAAPPPGPAVTASGSTAAPAAQPADGAPPKPAGEPGSPPGSSTPPEATAAAPEAAAAPVAASPAAAGAPARSADRPAKVETDPFALLERIAARQGGSERSPTASIVDFAPHIWRRAASYAAALSTDPQATADRGRLLAALQNWDAPTAEARGVVASCPPVEQLARAVRVAGETGVSEAWASASDEIRRAAAARDDAFELGWSLLEVIGDISGGTAEPPVDPGVLRNLLDRLRESTRVIAGGRVRDAALDPATGSARDRLEPATQNLFAYIAVVRALQTRMLAGLVPDGEGDQDVTFRERTSVLRSRLPSAEQRRSLAMPPAATRKRMLVASTDIRPPVGSRGRALDGRSLGNLAALVEVFLDFAEAAIAEFPATETRTAAEVVPVQNEIAAARSALSTLASRADDSDAAIDALVAVGARTARVLSRAAVAAQAVAAAGNPSRAARSRLGAFLRLLDPRDAATVGPDAVAAPPNWEAAVVSRLSLRPLADGNQRAGIVAARLAVKDSVKLSADASMMLRFDPAQVKVGLADGTVFRDGMAVPARDLPWRDDAVDLEVTLLRRSRGMNDDDRVTLGAALVVDGRTERTTLPVVLPPERGLVVAVRHAAGTVAGEPRQDGWVRPAHASVDGQGRLLPTLAVNARPGQVTPWTLGIENLSGTNRTIAVEIYSCRHGVGESREQRVLDLVAAIQANAPSAPAFARAKGLVIPAGVAVTSLAFPSPESKPDQAPKPGEKTEEKTGAVELPAPVAEEVGRDLLVAIRDESSADVLVTWIAVNAVHPRELVTAAAVYDHPAREIRVRLKAATDAAVLPAAGVKADLTGFSTVTAAGGVVPRKSAATIRPDDVGDELVASWTGADQGTARFSIDVDGYPRAFTFAVDCSAAADGRVQKPQDDWRQARILEPAVGGQTLLAAPVEQLPMRLAVDAPADAFVSGAAKLALVLRPTGVELGGDAEERTAWTADADRRIVFTRVPAPAGASLAVRTDVSDWSIAPSGQGLSNVDVEAELRLGVPGVAEPLVDRRSYVFDGQPPVVRAPPDVQIEAGRPVTVPLLVSDALVDEYLSSTDRRRPGSSGLRTVEWAIDLEGTGAPKEWKPAVRIRGADYEIRLDTAALPLGSRVALLVRALDNVGLSSPVARTWLVVAPDPFSKRNAIVGRVTADGRGEAGVVVTVTGPGGERTGRSGPDGGFRFEDLEPGSYKASAAGTVRNRTRKAAAVDVTVEARPALPASVTLKLD